MHYRFDDCHAARGGGVTGITICVEYDDLLSITLPRNVRHLTECLVVTSPDDVRTQKLASDIPDVRLLVTDAFTRHGSEFNKGLAMEEGLQTLRDDSPIIIWDADTLFPDTMRLPPVLPDCLYGPTRRMLEDPSTYYDRMDWEKQHRTVDVEYPGFFQLFDPGSGCLQDQPYWYDPTFAHAGGGDAFFQTLFPHKVRLSFDVLHLGPRDANWFGRTTQRLDGNNVSTEQVQSRQQRMLALRERHGWDRSKASDPSTADRVAVPGVTSDYNWHNVSLPPT